MQETNKFSLACFKPGALFYFDVCGTNLRFVGEVDKIARNGVKSWLAYFSRTTNVTKVNDDGSVEHEQLAVLEKSDRTRMCNVAHAVRLLKPGYGNVQLNDDAYFHPQVEITRFGNCIAIVELAFESYFFNHILPRYQDCIQHGEIVENPSVFYKALMKAGICKKASQFSYDPVIINTKRMKKYLDKNFNRFKCNLHQAWKEEQAENERYYNETFDADMDLLDRAASIDI